MIEFEWCYELGQIVKTDEMDGTNSAEDMFEIIDRKLVKDEGQYFWLKRLSDGQIWEWVGAMIINELPETNEKAGN